MFQRWDFRDVNLISSNRHRTLWVIHGVHSAMYYHRKKCYCHNFIILEVTGRFRIKIAQWSFKITAVFSSSRSWSNHTLETWPMWLTSTGLGADNMRNRRTLIIVMDGRDNRAKIPNYFNKNNFDLPFKTTSCQHQAICRPRGFPNTWCGLTCNAACFTVIRSPKQHLRRTSFVSCDSAPKVLATRLHKREASINKVQPRILYMC